MLVVHWVKALGVELYSTENEEKSSVVERWNRTMKERMFKYFTVNSTWKYIDVLDDMVKLYNNSRHSSIKMKPVEASMTENQATVRTKLGLHDGRVLLTPKFSVGDKVRITVKKNIIVCPVGQDYCIGDSAFKGENGKFDPSPSQNVFTYWHEILHTWLRRGDDNIFQKWWSFGKGKVPLGRGDIDTNKVLSFFIRVLRHAHRSHQLTYTDVW